ncbi:MAG: sensor domain-containing diguanylate cyclase [Myxococcales bacterium]|nr:sensor domain-containing diguanylate cyclase [Myxococcales bacterium]
MTTTRDKQLPKVLFEIGKTIGSGLEPERILTRISELTCGLISADACSVMLLDASRQRLLVKAAYGLRTERVAQLSFAVGEGVAGWVLETGETALIPDVRYDTRFVRRDGSRTPILSLLCVPLISRGDRVGVITVTASRAAVFSGEDAEILGFIAATIALDLENVRLHRVAVTDALTGAYNREFLGQQLPIEIDAARSRKQGLSVAMVDVDHFKSINDRFGHDVGDVVLAEVSRRLKSATRGGDLLIRYGGEEFLVVLPRADAASGLEVGERMRVRVEESPIVITHADERLELSVRVSVGVATLRTIDASETAAELIKRADAALYAAKARGRNRVEQAA